ncbi:unnamed protein product [Vicia faba]|uniref:Uncharacterized protein n=1 Tax=Vicia faba TaxID=3906 RepID=A0AAV1AE90_VICFA|nr:unnamed protein product [Vicia faba]
MDSWHMMIRGYANSTMGDDDPNERLNILSRYLDLLNASIKTPLEVVHQAIFVSTYVVSNDAYMEVVDQEDVVGLSADVSKKAFKEIVQLSTVGLSVKSSEEAYLDISH